MSLLTPPQIKALCETYRLSPSKKYGQHYLISEAPIRKMIEVGELSPDDTVVEIGPGFGILTCAVAPLVDQVVAFEIEKKLEPYWEAQKAAYPNVAVVWGNFLQQFEPGHAPYKVLANLPYQITSDALRTLLEAVPAPERIIVMVQKEVGERMCAKPGDMSLLSVAVQYYGIPRLAAQVPRGSFWPMPQVDSAILAITRIGTLGRRSAPEDFFRVAKAGFAQKRKQLWHNLAAGLRLPRDQVKSVLLKATGNEKIRAEELSIGQWEEVVEGLARA